MKSDVSTQCLTDDLDSSVSYTILTEINSLKRENIRAFLTDVGCTYTELLLEGDPLGEGRHNFISEVNIASEIERLELLELAQLPEDRTNAGHIHDGIVLKSHLHEVLPIFQIGKDCLGLVLINDTVLSDVAETAYKISPVSRQFIAVLIMKDTYGPHLYSSPS